MDDVLKVSTWYILERVNNYDLPLYEFAVHLFEQQAQFFHSDGYELILRQ